MQVVYQSKTWENIIIYQKQVNKAQTFFAYRSYKYNEKKKDCYSLTFTHEVGID